MDSQLQTSDPFHLWEKALASDRDGDLAASKSMFGQAAQLFFVKGSDGKPQVGRAFFEYSTLMDAFARVQEARLFKKNSKYDDSLSEFTKASEIFRSSVHFGFLAGYESGCATLETALELDDPDGAFQAFKNANALFEQSKLALGLRDEKHPLIDVIDTLIKFSISEAFLAESKSLSQSGKVQEAREKILQSKAISKEHEFLARRIGTRSRSIDYFPMDDWKRAETTCLVLSYPESDSILLCNVGTNSVLIETLGNRRIDKTLDPLNSISCPMDVSSKGRVRVIYVDLKEKKEYDEGCLLMI
ncbi:MAG TPA: hypothetical protein VNE86_07760 [Nitrososphaerales archaeon]|nr:hypothetical protein [Nitrososphaerales archaeon]